MELCYSHGLVMVDSPTMKKSFTISDIKPLDLYDSTRAKICASVGWLLGKSYGSAGRFGLEQQACGLFGTLFSTSVA